MISQGNSESGRRSVPAEHDLSASNSTSYADVLHRASQQLSGTSPTAVLDAQVLLGHVLQKDQAWLVAHGGESMGEDALRRYAELLARRLRGEPVAHITGSREFWSLELAVSPAVLIPRPETELLVECALRRIPPTAEWRIADLGTGSGAVALAIAAERPGCRLVATDIAGEALQLAAQNARQLGIDNLEFVRGSWCRPLARQRFQMIVSNPPYVADDDPHLQQGDLPREPPLALQAGPAGLDALAVIASQARDRLTEPGWLMLEHGYGQQRPVADLLVAVGYRDIECHRDYAGLPRVTECRTDATGSEAS